MPDRGERRGEIVRVAFDQLARTGFEGLRLRQIAADVGIDHSTLHHHFPGKQDIVAEVARYTIGRFVVELPRGRGRADSLLVYLDHVRGLLASAPELFVVVTELDLRARRDPEVRAVMDHHVDNWRHWVHDLLSAGAAREWSPRVDPAGGAELILATIKGVALAPDTAASAFAQLRALLVR